ncbi:MAG: ABC transporter permease [Gaiellales bacterium]
MSAGDSPETVDGAAGPFSARLRLGPAATWVPQAILIGIIAIGIIVAIAITPRFLTWPNTLAILRNTAIVGIVAVGMTPMTLSGSLVSLGVQQSAMASALTFIALLGDGWSQPVAMVLVILLLCAIGAAQGLIVALGLNPVITTLAAGAVIYGVAASWSDGQVLTVGAHVPSWGDSKIVGLPIEVFVFVLFTALVSVVVSRTVIGRQTVLTGANRATAGLSGISFLRVTVFAFAVFSVGVAIAGILYGAAFTEGNITAFPTLTVDAVAAVLVGGTAIQGGFGSPLRSAIGALLIAIISNIMLLNDFTTGGRLATQGAVVTGVVVILQLLRRRSQMR